MSEMLIKDYTLKQMADASRRLSGKQNRMFVSDIISSMNNTADEVGIQSRLIQSMQNLLLGKIQTDNSVTVRVSNTSTSIVAVYSSPPEGIFLETILAAQTTDQARPLLKGSLILFSAENSISLACEGGAELLELGSTCLAQVNENCTITITTT